MTSQTQISVASSAQAPRITGAAGRYGEALFDLAVEAGALEPVEADLTALQKAMDENEEFSRFLASPVYGRDEKEVAISAIADKAQFNPLTKNFLGLIARKGRLFSLPAMIDAFSKLAAHHRGEVYAEATSAAPLNDEQLRRLRGEIEGMIGKAVNLATKVDPALLGGLVVKVGSTMIDSSLRTKLNKIKSAMKEA